MNIINQNQADTANSDVMNAEKDAIPTLSSKAMFWRPRYLAESLWLEHIPFYFWLVEAQQSNLIFEPELTSGSTYFAMCQAVEKLNLDTRCLGVFNPINRKYEESVSKYNSENYREFSYLVDEPLKDTIYDFEDESIDVMILKYSSALLFNKNLMDAWQKKLSKKSVVLIQGSQKKEAKHLCRKLKQTYNTFEFTHGNGLLLVCFGESPSAKIQFLVNRGVNDTSTRVIQDIYSRLGVACNDAYVNKVNCKKVNELNEILLLKVSELSDKSKIEKENSHLSENIKTRFDEIASLTKILIETEKERDQQALSVNDQKSIVDKLKQELKEKDLQLEMANENQFKVIGQLNNKLNDAQSALKQAEEINKSLALYEDQISELMRQNDFLEKDQIAAADIISNLKKENNILKASVEQRFHEVSVLTGMLQDKDKEIKVLSDALKNTESELNDSLVSRLSLSGIRRQNKFKKSGKVRLKRKVKLLRESELFDADWYMAEYPESKKYKSGVEAHYLCVGAELGFNPSQNFDTKWYLSAYPDVAEVGVNPLLHYIEFGREEGRLLP